MKKTGLTKTDVLRRGIDLVYQEVVKKFAWDPDFTKPTPEEQKCLEAAEERIDSGEYVKDSDIEW